MTMPFPDLGRLLAANTFFASLGPEALSSIAALCITRRLEAGQTLFLKGDPGDALYAIRRGQVRITTDKADGQNLTLNLLGSGDVFGEVALLDGQSRTATAIASEPTDLFVVLRRDFLALLARQPSVAVQVIELLCARIRWMSTQAEDTAFLPLDRRLGRRLLSLAIDYGNEIEISQEDLASFVGATRESVNRHLQVWKRAGIVGLSRGRITLLTPQRLARVGISDEGT
ncbi:Crp/Fnr family transcriptional regulator [Methylobacterium iners]|uniref:Cyclic AMP receptor protein n=1 Tax=Methylobacterium iners TaxID=418707 RepID=A0ABQ4S3B0_9HYPH|nr:Crp/Fnr family transcriptional regulator [Methylobacterium iners]GJD96662.1 Cyclic AMP receptor protein [Methylobacterium iners]